jgi:hypothetical protein
MQRGKFNETEKTHRDTEENEEKRKEKKEREGTETENPFFFIFVGLTNAAKTLLSALLPPTRPRSSWLRTW